MPESQGRSRASAGRDEPDGTFAVMAESVAPRLYRVALRMCGKPEDAEDLVQDTLLQAFRKWGQFEGRSSPATWLYTIAARQCQRRRRRRAGEPARLEPLADGLPSPADPVLTLQAPGDGPLDAHLRAEAGRAVAEGLARLPDQYRLPLVLADIAELSTSEIACILGLKEATVKTRIHRARLAIRRILLERLPTQAAASPPNHDRRVCLDLLRAKQDALDRRVPFPYSREALCERCRSVFAALDLGQDACGRLDGERLPPAIYELIRGQRPQAPSPGRARR